jgi:hypothetical protein
MTGWKSEMKKICGIICIILLVLTLILILRGSEDTWIKDERGCWIKHGNPSQTPDYVLEQQNLTNCSEKIIASIQPEK